MSGAAHLSGRICTALFVPKHQAASLPPHMLTCSSPHPFSDDPLTTCRKIVNWRLFLKFPDEIAVSPAAKDLITKLMCDVEERLGTLGVHEIKVGAGIRAWGKIR